MMPAVTYNELTIACPGNLAETLSPESEMRNHESQY